MVCWIRRGSRHLEVELLGLLPGEVGVGEVAVLGRLAVDGLDEVELLDNDTGAHVEVVADNLDELVRGLVGSAVGLDEDGEGLGDTDGVGELDEGAAGEAGGDERLGDPAGEVGGRTVDLGVVLAGEGSTAVGAPTAVGVDDDLAAGETGVTLRTTDDEETGRLDLGGGKKSVSEKEGDSRPPAGLKEAGSNSRGRRSCRRGTWRG